MPNSPSNKISQNNFMNDQIEKTIKELPEMEFPNNLHGKIMRKVSFLKFRFPVITVILLLTINTILTGSHFISKISRVESVSILKDLFSRFEFSSSFFANLKEVITDYFPTTSLIIVLINIILIAYVLYLGYSLKKYRLKVA